jgi:hypothetical protein
VTPFLFSTDPYLQIAKVAYVDVGDTSSAAQIEATGTMALGGSRLLDGQMVCFVYTVTNTSVDTWATKLSNVRVTDTDQRLGDSGVIATIPVIPIGESAKVAACSTVVPVDTTTTEG